MTTVTGYVRAPRDAVWEVLADGWLYPLWVVGATRMRAVDETWPAVGAALHHSVGVWPAILNDDTQVEECDPGRQLTLVARGRPMGEARVVLRLYDEGPRTRVTISEDAVSGPGRLVPLPLRAPGIYWRNTESLRRLAFLTEGRQREGSDRR